MEDVRLDSAQIVLFMIGQLEYTLQGRTNGISFKIDILDADA